ncbi:GNAT family N-acetyltransferase [Fulvivirga ligni]|uniref:GNAT family N-acetyltransferase n=1 Tax=Fulvivirga ligni TaxID=2904246 RepID=UPI001F1D2D9A|nr:GNAT family N-acetyltransferase [Fulvivirga ligni]UII23884.1 GNAT family N-acetyltransferase [Fulvivirga ligni]
METKLAAKEDIPKIVDLLKISLGESLMPKSVEYWTWKHINNPFGASPVLLAMENNQIIGVRAFMTWQWRKENKVYKAIRAVDTATHPDHQGKGIFKKLTLGLLDVCKDQGVDLVFNTPNEKSKPGYLKMGWEEAGKMPVKIGFKRPLSMVVNKLKSNSNTEFVPVENSEFDILKSIKRYSAGFKLPSCWKTDYSLEYLKWRYSDIPIIQYGGVGDSSAIVIFRIKKSSLGKELRISDAFGEEARIKGHIKQIYNNFEFDYISIDGFSSHSLPSLISKKLNNGPEVTVRSVNADVEEFTNFRNWYPSLGDLEVF